LKNKAIDFQLKNQNFSPVIPTQLAIREVANLADEFSHSFKTQIADAVYTHFSGGQLTTNQQKFLRLSACKTILRYLINQYQKLDHNTEKQFLGIEDNQNNLQAVAMITNTPDYIYVNLLATAPWNTLPENSDPRMIKGAGRALIELIIKYSYQQNSRGVIKLSAYEQSLSFYQELGFIQASNSNSKLDLILPISLVQNFIQ
jgi:predicted GNAT family N-acyltransferase